MVFGYCAETILRSASRRRSNSDFRPGGDLSHTFSPSNPSIIGSNRCTIPFAVRHSRAQKDQPMNVFLGREQVKQWTTRRGWEIAGEYVDEAISGAKDKQPQLDRLMAGAHKRRFDGVVVWKFDRFARSVSHLLRALETFKALGIQFVSFSEQMDTSTPTGKMIFTVLGAVAELERSLIAERVRAGLRNAKAKGKRLGRPSIAVDTARIANPRASGASWPMIARELSISVGKAYQAGQNLSQIPKI